MRHMTVFFFSFASEKSFSLNEQLEGERGPFLSQSWLRMRNPRHRRLGGTVKSSQIRKRKGSVNCKALFQFELGFGLSAYLMLYELMLLIHWCLGSGERMLTGHSHRTSPGGIHSLAFISQDRVSLSCLLNQGDASSLIYSEASGAITWPRLLLAVCSMPCPPTGEPEDHILIRCWGVSQASQLRKGEKGSSCQGKQMCLWARTSALDGARWYWAHTSGTPF